MTVLKVYESSTPPITDIRVVEDGRGYQWDIQIRRGDGPWETLQKIKGESVRERDYDHMRTLQKWVGIDSDERLTATQRRQMDEMMKRRNTEVEREMSKAFYGTDARTYMGIDPATGTDKSVWWKDPK